MKTLFAIGAAFLISIPICKAAETPTLAWPVDQYDVAWDSPSADARGSMPLGNGDTALNVWVEQNGDLVLLVAKSDSFDEFNRLLKLGRIRIKTTPALWQPGETFSQVLKLSDGAIEIAAGKTNVRVWVDANHPVAQVDLTAAEPVGVQVTLEDWRKEKRQISVGSGGEGFSMWGNWPDKYLVNPDTILPARDGQIAWCHRNIESQWQKNLQLTGLASEIPKEEDPVLGRTFGALVRCADCTAVSGTELQTQQPVSRCSIRIFPWTMKADSTDTWLGAVSAGADTIQHQADSARFEAHQAWWHAFWNRSWIDVTGGNFVSAMTYHGPLLVGHDPTGQSRFGGTISGAISANRVMTADEIAKLVSGNPDTQSAGTPGDITFSTGYTVAAWIKPAPGEGGRIFDKTTPGHSDGLLFDTWPGLSLRFDAGGAAIRESNILKPNVWQHVAATFDAATGTQKLYLNGKLLDSKTSGSDSTSVAQDYNLQRFILGCAGRGGLPIKFNGSLFTVEGPDPDFRRWGGAYWWQNTRLPYWTMIESGDYDLMQPLFKMYRQALPLREAATQAYYHHAGAFFPETMYFWGNYVDENYGFDRKGKPDGLTDNGYIRRYWQSGIELVAMMLDVYDHTRDAAFRDRTLLPIARDIVEFYDQHWPRGADGKILFQPSQSLETWWDTKNPTPEIAGLRFILPRLLQLPVDAATKTKWNKMLADLPPIPTVSGPDGVRVSPAETWSSLHNSENTELYAVFPYRMFTCLGSAAEEQIGLNTWHHRAHPEDGGWQQNVIQAALLGLADEAKTMEINRSRGTAPGYRFPVFFGPNYDWTPDQDHASNMLTALQRMVMQCEGRRIVLLPAWPADWNASFRLHAPHNTTVEGRVENGKVTGLKVTPESRRADVEVRGNASR